MQSLYLHPHYLTCWLMQVLALPHNQFAFSQTLTSTAPGHMAKILIATTLHVQFCAQSSLYLINCCVLDTVFPLFRAIGTPQLC